MASEDRPSNKGKVQSLHLFKPIEEVNVYDHMLGSKRTKNSTKIAEYFGRHNCTLGRIFYLKYSTFASLLITSMVVFIWKKKQPSPHFLRLIPGRFFPLFDLKFRPSQKNIRH